MRSGSPSDPSPVCSIVEHLEARRLFAVTNRNEFLDIVGTKGDDTIEVRMHADGQRIVVLLNGENQGAFSVGADPEWYVSANGKGGDDIIRVVESNGQLPVRVNFIGGTGNDTLIGGKERTGLVGGSGNDFLQGGDAPDGTLSILNAGKGRDTIFAGNGVDHIFAGSGDDVVRELGFEDRIEGISHGERVNGSTVRLFDIEGTRGDDAITITVADNGEFATVALNGDVVEEINNIAAFRVRVRGRAGDDTITVEDTEANSLNWHAIRLKAELGNDTITAGFRRVFAYGDDGNDTITGSAGDDILYGADGNDELFGGDGNDTMRGGEGDDALDGQAGNDWIKGSFGNDLLTGGSGDDIITARQNDDDTVEGGAGQDTIEGLAGPDVIG